MDSKWSEVPGSSGTLGEHFEPAQDTENERGTGAKLIDVITPRHRMIARLAKSLANDLEHGTYSEQWTSGLLKLVADAIDNCYTPELTEAMRTWAAKRQQNGEG